jgi:hypothetical protein
MTDVLNDSLWLDVLNDSLWHCGFINSFKNFEDHVNEVLDRLKSSNLRINGEKS